MAQKGGVIRVKRAPVLTLWAAIVAERLGHDADAAITLGRAVAGSSARVKAHAIGLEEKREDGGVREGASLPRGKRCTCSAATCPWLSGTAVHTRSTTTSRPLRVRPAPM